MEKFQVAVACRNASGESDMPIFTVFVTAEEYDLGIHHDKAEALADNAGYERPFVCFDDSEHSAIITAARELELVPRVVAVDLTESFVRSIRCDAGEIKVICYDAAETEKWPIGVVDMPVGENGSSVRCFVHVQTADVDPSLAKARD